MNKNAIYPQVAVGAVIFKDDKVLLVKRSHQPAKGYWAIPGGKIKPGETMQQALVRELREETDLEIIPGKVVYVFDVIETNPQNEIDYHYVIIDFLCQYKSRKIKAGDDALDVKWVSARDLSQLDVNENTRTMLKDKFNFY